MARWAFTIGLAILIPFLVLVLIYIVASLDEHPLFRKLLSKKAVADKSPSLDLDKGNIASEEQVEPRKRIEQIPIEDRYPFEEWSSDTRDDLPETHRYRSMRFRQTPIGLNFLDTE